MADGRAAQPAPAWRRLAAYGAVAALAARNRLAYPGELALSQLFLVVVFFVFVQLWPAAYAGRASVAGLSLPELLTYLVATEALLAAPRSWTAIQAEVRSGDVAVQWARPVHYAAWHLAAYLGEAAVRVPLAFAVGAAVVWVHAGGLAVVPRALPAAMAAAVLALLINFCLELVTGLSAFWSEDAAGWNLLVAMARLLAGGVLLPLEMVPDAVARALRLLPFPYAIYGPARVLVSPDPSLWRAVLAGQAAWLAALCLLAGGVLAAARRRVFIHGG